MTEFIINVEYFVKYLIMYPSYGAFCICLAISSYLQGISAVNSAVCDEAVF